MTTNCENCPYRDYLAKTLDIHVSGEECDRWGTGKCMSKVKVKTCDSYCRNCKYVYGVSTGIKMCVYLERTGKMRGCPAGTGCDKKERKGRKNAKKTASV